MSGRSSFATLKELYVRADLQGRNWLTKLRRFFRGTAGRFSSRRRKISEWATEISRVFLIEPKQQPGKIKQQDPIMRYQKATNLFAGLSRYSLKATKSPLENFCTELLAWCLQNSADFRKEFLSLIRLDFLEKFEGQTEIATQQYWRSDKEKDDDESEGDFENRKSGFFDMAIYTAQRVETEADFLIVIESKIDADFGAAQLPDYRAELERLKKRGNYPNCALVTLTKYSANSDFSNGHIKWSQIRWPQVQELLSKTRNEDGLEIIYRQFAEFLAEKGMKPMRIPKTTPQFLASFFEAKDFQENLESILNGLRDRKEFGFLSRQRKLKIEEDDDGTSWFGIYASDGTWAGFGFGNSRKHEFKFSMRVGKPFAGKLIETDVLVPAELARYLKRPPDYDEGQDQTWFNFDQPIESSFDGNAEEIDRWLAITSRAVLQLRAVPKA